jgi:hypothetical protein
MSKKIPEVRKCNGAMKYLPSIERQKNFLYTDYEDWICIYRMVTTSKIRQCSKNKSQYTSDCANIHFDHQPTESAVQFRTQVAALDAF